MAGLTDFLKTVYAPSRIEIGAESLRQMEISVRLLERWAGRSLELTDLSEDLIRRWLADYRQTHSAATTNSKRCQILALWRCAWEEELLTAPPRARKIRKCRPSPAVPEAWSVTEVSRIIESARQDRQPIGGVWGPDWWESVLLVLYDTGERRSAVFRLRPQDVSLAGPWIIFPRTKQGRPRWAAIHADTAAAIKRIYDPAEPLLWPWPFSREALDKRFRAILKRAGVAYGRGRGGLFHKLRRTSGSLIEAAGGDGARHIGDTRRVFEAHYSDPRITASSQIGLLPRP